MTDRVSERRRAAQLARHYRGQEGLTIAEIARRLGRAEGTVKAYLYDPLGDKAREVKARYRGSVGAAARRPARGMARATRTPIASAAVPGDRAAADPRAGPGGDARLASALRRRAVLLRLVAHARTPARRRSVKRLQTGEWPAPSTVIDLYGSWAAAVDDAFGA